MDPLDFIPVAERCCYSTDEAERRTAVGRYYYAVFNHARNLVESAGRAVPVAGDAHRCVRYYFREAARGLPALAPIATKLGSMREDRNTADYEMTTVVDPATAELAQRRANELIAQLAAVSVDRLRGALQAVPTCPPSPR